MEINKYGPFGLSKEQEEIRLSNLVTVQTFFSLEGPDRHEKRKKIYAKDGRFELNFMGQDTRKPVYTYQPNATDRANVETNSTENNIFPDWGFHDIKIYSTDDPNMVYATCTGRGMRYDPRFDEPHFYENNYFLEFVMEDGHIKVLRELGNPFKMLQPSGHDVPDMFI